jgi:KUP system potassium uptake protein
MSNSPGPHGQDNPLAPTDSDGDLSAFLTPTDTDAPNPTTRGTSALVLGAVGVVYGDIGTSPIYAFREAIKPVAGDTILTAHVLGLLSLLIWTLILIVTFKYVLILLRADNRGEGGVLALYTLARQARWDVGRCWVWALPARRCSLVTR